MDMLHPRRQTYVRRYKKYSYMQLKQMAIIFGFIIVATVISVLLPIYFAYLPVAGGR